MVLKRKKFKNEPTGNRANRKGYRSRSSESQLPNKRMSTFEAKQRAKYGKEQNLIIEAETLMNYYKDLIK